MAERKRAEPGTDRETGGLPLKLWRALCRAHATLSAAAAEEAALHGLTVGELEVLDTLRRAGRPLPVGELQRRVRVSSGGATYLVSRLEARVMVERQGDPADRRARFAVLTPAGGEAAAAAQSAFAERMRRAGSGLGKKDRRALVELLDALEESCAAEEIRAAGQRTERSAAEVTQR
jgi:DNA-binding MarR family transcriptional regulator